MKRMASAKSKPKSKASLVDAKSKTQKVPTRFLLCIRNDGYAASLEPRKVYETMPDPSALEHKMVRIIDESGEDYLYPAAFFAPIAISKTLVQRLEKSA